MARQGKPQETVELELVITARVNVVVPEFSQYADDTEREHTRRNFIDDTVRDLQSFGFGKAADLNSRAQYAVNRAEVVVEVMEDDLFSRRSYGTDN